MYCFSLEKHLIKITYTQKAVVNYALSNLQLSGSYHILQQYIKMDWIKLRHIIATFQAIQSALLQIYHKHKLVTTNGSYRKSQVQWTLLTHPRKL